MNASSIEERIANARALLGGPFSDSIIRGIEQKGGTPTLAAICKALEYQVAISSRFLTNKIFKNKESAPKADDPIPPTPQPVAGVMSPMGDKPTLKSVSPRARAIEEAVNESQYVHPRLPSDCRDLLEHWISLKHSDPQEHSDFYRRNRTAISRARRIQIQLIANDNR